MKTTYDPAATFELKVSEEVFCARLEGFSLHANVALDARAREQLEHLCRYLLRPPMALDRLTESPNGQLTYQLPHPPRDGATHLLLDPLEFIEKLCALIPRPGFTCSGSMASWPPAPDSAPKSSLSPAATLSTVVDRRCRPSAPETRPPPA